MSFNVIEELQELQERKCPPSISKCYEYNHSKRKDVILWYSIIANTDNAQCTIGVKLYEHYHNGFLRPAFPNLVKRLADFGHPIQFYPSLSPHHYDGMHSIYNAEVACHLPSLSNLDFSLVSEIVNGVPLNVKRKNQQVLYGYTGQDQKRQNNDDIINKPSSTPKENSHLGIGALIPLSKLNDEMDPNYVLHASPSQHEERSDKWAWPLIATEKKVNQNEAIFNFLEYSSLILNEWAVSGDGLDYMKLEPDLSTDGKQ
jgi:hypothetical protein